MSARHYNAFISYSHHDCRKIAPKIQGAIENIGKPWYWIGRKNLNLFRDDTDISANPELWKSIVNALSNSDYLILLASPSTVTSKWIQKEVEWWLSNKDINTLIMTVVKGSVYWVTSAGVNDFDWGKTDCLPPNLQRRFSDEPLYIDIRPYVTADRLNTREEAGFKAQMVKVISTIVGKPPREIDSDELTRQNNIKRFLSVTGLLLVGLLTSLLFMFLDLRRSNLKIQSQLAKSYWDNSRRAIAENNSLLALHYAAEAVVISPDTNLTRNILLDIETRLPPNNLKNVFLHEDGVLGAIFSRDGKWILTASSDHTARLWEAETGKQIGATMQHRKDVLSAVFSADGKEILTASADSTARIWETGTGRQIGPSMQHPDEISSAVFSQDGKWILTAGNDRTIRLWEANTGQETGVSIHLTDDIYSVTFSLDGKKILTLDMGKNAQLWEAASGKQIGSTMQHEGKIYGAAFSPDGKWVLTACGGYSKWIDDDNVLRAGENTAQLWEAATGKRTGHFMQHQGDVYSAVFSSDGKYILTASSDSTARLWEAETGDQIGPVMKHHGPVAKALFSPDGKQVLTIVSTTYQTVQLWEIDTTRQTPHFTSMLIKMFNPNAGVKAGRQTLLSIQHESDITSAVFSPDSKRILTASLDHTAKLWEIVPLKKFVTVIQHPRPITSASFDFDAKRISTTIYSSPDKKEKITQLWETASGRPVSPAMYFDNNKYAILSPDAKWILTSGEEIVRLWEVATGKQIGAPMEHKATVTTAVFNSDAKMILTSSLDSTARLWASGTNKQIGPSMHHPGWLTSAVFSPDEKTILTACDDSTVRVWEVGNNKSTGIVIHEPGVYNAIFSPDGKMILTASQNNVSRLWDAVTGKQIGPSMVHEVSSMITSIKFSPDGKQILTSTSLGAVRLWETGTGKQIGPTMQHEAYAYASFSPDGKLILTASKDRTARLWESVTNRQIGPSLNHENSVHLAEFSPDGKLVLTVSDTTAYIWNIEADLDIPSDLFRLQINAITGGEFNVEISAIHSIPLIQYQKIKEEYDTRAREHYKICKYPAYNLWRRFNPKEAEKLR